MSPGIPEEQEMRVEESDPRQSLATFDAWGELILEMASQLNRKDLSKVLVNVCNDVQV